MHSKRGSRNMFERFTESSRRVLFFARYEASQLGGITIETDHLLLGLTREAKGVICEIFAASHVSLKSIRHEIEARAASGEKISTSVEIPLSEESKRVLQYSTEEADRLQHNHIGTEHLLLGLLREASCSAALTLSAHGLRLAEVRSDIVKLGESHPVLGLPTHTAETDEHIERIKRLVVKLAATSTDANSESTELLERILRELDTLRGRLSS
jgi:ATP-dependent Clp protease ATP-binding subunit ClpA